MADGERPKGRGSEQQAEGAAKPPKPDPRLVEWVARDKTGEQKVPKKRDKK
jgi:hypothetical protein